MSCPLLSAFVLALALCIPPAAHAQSGAAAGGRDDSVFESAPAPFAPDIFGDKQQPEGILRVLTVDERMGYARENELVRVPLFFHEAEASADPGGYVITPTGGGKAITYQADDIRRDKSEKIARMHLYFILDDLPAWGRKQFELWRGKNPAGRDLPLTETDGMVTLEGEDIKVTFHSKGAAAGAIAALETTAGAVDLPDRLLGPAATIIRQPAPGAPPAHANAFNYTRPDSLRIKDLKWSSGPVFSKLAVRITPEGAPNDIAEYRYIVPKFGSEFTQTQLLYPDGPNSIETVGTETNALLYGKIALGDPGADQKVFEIPAGIRKNLRSFFGYKGTALVNEKDGISLAMVPYLTMGARGIGIDDSGNMAWNGPGEFRTQGNSGSDSLRVWWGQVRFIFSKNTSLDDLWHQQCAKFQPLTAVVDEPWATPESVLEFAKVAVKEYYKVQWGRGYEANLAMAWLDGRDIEGFFKEGSQPNQDPRAFIPSVEAVDAAWKKWQGAGALDPYGISHASSAGALISAYIRNDSAIDRWMAALGVCSWLVNGQLTPEGWPNIRTFANTANMKAGPYLVAIYGGKATGDKNLFRWGTDAATAQNLLANYGHGERPYDMSPGNRDQSPFVYISITDFWLRASELLTGEDLMLHPSIYGRYADAVDVNADIYQRKPVRHPDTKEVIRFDPLPHRAAFLRLQSYDFRWMGFAGEPYLGMLGKASDRGRVGMTEAAYSMHHEIGTEKSWNRLMTGLFFPAMMVAEGWKSYRPAPRPTLPDGIRIQSSDSGNSVTWNPVPGVAGYRIFRSEGEGQPWVWLNSPYPKIPKFKIPTQAELDLLKARAEAADAAKAKGLGLADAKKLKRELRTPAWSLMSEIRTPGIPDTLVKVARFHDPEGNGSHLYLITAEDAAGRQSRWFPNEPLPAASE